MRHGGATVVHDSKPGRGSAKARCRTHGKAKTGTGQAQNACYLYITVDNQRNTLTISTKLFTSGVHKPVYKCGRKVFILHPVAPSCGRGQDGVHRARRHTGQGRRHKQRLQTRLLYLVNKASLLRKQALFVSQRRLLCCTPCRLVPPQGRGVGWESGFADRRKAFSPQPVNNSVDNSHNNSQVFNTRQNRPSEMRISTTLLMGCEEVFHNLRTKIIGNLLTLHLFRGDCGKRAYGTHFQHEDVMCLCWLSRLHRLTTEKPRKKAESFQHTNKTSSLKFFSFFLKNRNIKNMWVWRNEER